ncbi:MAG: hypothetical protein NTW21_26395 [Verrucomicrobia bacterium]|nr:hypothetical protein [Verrucomicrobiota bacterium]
MLAKTATVDRVVYTVEGAHGLSLVDQSVTEIPAETDMPGLLDSDWSYRTFQLDGVIPARGSQGFLRVVITGPVGP